MNEKEKPALEKAADKINDAVEEIALKAADAAIEPDPEHVAGKSNEQLYLPQAGEAVAPPNQSGRITPTYDFPEPKSPMKKSANKEKAKR
jgi:hypothetical protein